MQTYTINRNHFFLSSFISSYFKILLVTITKVKTNTTTNADKDFGDCNFDISENKKRLVRATLKTYDQTGTYVFLKVFKKATEGAEFESVQRLSLSSEEFSKLLKSEKPIRAQTSDISDTVENKDKSQSNCKRARKTQTFLKHKRFQARLELIFFYKTAEAMFGIVLPDYFKKFQQNFKFVITEKVPNLSTFKNFAFGSHFKSKCCPFSVKNEKNSLP